MTSRPTSSASASSDADRPPDADRLKREQQPEASLVGNAKAGDQDALAELLTRRQSQLFAICLRIVGNRQDAEELTQEAMVRAISNLAHFDDRARFSTWITRIAINLCLSHLRKQKLRRHISLDAPGGAGDETSMGSRISQRREPDAGPGVESDDDMERLNRAMQRLDPQQRAMLILRDGRGLGYQQIADAMDIAIGTVKSRLFRARAALRDAIENPHDHEQEST